MQKQHWVCHLSDQIINCTLYMHTLCQKLMAMVSSKLITWCHQYIGIYRISPGPTTASTPRANANFGNLLKSGLSKLTWDCLSCGWWTGYGYKYGKFSGWNSKIFFLPCKGQNKFCCSSKWHGVTFPCNEMNDHKLPKFFLENLHIILI